MKNRLKLCCLLFIIASCKYEDGPLISLVSPEKRIMGFYTIDFVEENGIDQMARIDTLNITYFSFGGPMEIDPNVNTFDVLISNSVFYYSEWNFVGSDEKQLYTGTFGCGSHPPDIVPAFQPLPGFRGSCSWDSIVLWNITKLTQKKLWLEAQINNNNYEVHLKPL
ncbi:MAG TPA: hypothetical protein VE978_04430 [Chitinophagales bacterium]|nr:hypothetical protein [Chitinophagales bacterium]